MRSSCFSSPGVDANLVLRKSFSGLGCSEVVDVASSWHQADRLNMNYRPNPEQTGRVAPTLETDTPF